jgi:hypothetical protein
MDRATDMPEVASDRHSGGAAPASLREFVRVCAHDLPERAIQAPARMRKWTIERSGCRRRAFIGEKNLPDFVISY